MKKVKNLTKNLLTLNLPDGSSLHLAPKQEEDVKNDLVVGEIEKHVDKGRLSIKDIKAPPSQKKKAVKDEKPAEKSD